MFEPVGLRNERKTFKRLPNININAYIRIKNEI